MTNLLDLPLDQFRGYLAEGNYPQARQDELMRAYRAKNSLAGWLDRYGEDAYKGRLGLLDDGNMKVSSYFPVAVPKGMSIWDGLKSGRFQTRFKDYASDALGGVLNALNNPRDSYQGTLPQADYDSAAMASASLPMVAGGVAAAPAGSLRSFAGRNAKTADLDALKMAQELSARKRDPEDIFRQTGWFKGKDGQWRFEIDDSQAEFIGNSQTTGLLGDVMRHDALYAAYPDLKNTPVSTDVQRSQSGSYQPAQTKYPDGQPRYTPLNEEIRAFGPTKPAILNTLLHEAGGHALQRREGFAPGSSRGTATDQLLLERNTFLKNLSDKMDARQAELGLSGYRPATNDLELKRLREQYDANVGRALDEDAIYERYYTEAGEVDARNIQLRQDMTPAERRALSPMATEDVPRSEQRLSGDGQSGLLAEAVYPVMQGRSRQGLTDFFNPDGVSWGTDSKSTAEQFAGKDAGLVYKYNDEGKLEVSEADSYLPGQVYDLNYDLENPMQVPIKDTLWTREKELAKIAEAKAKGHDGLKIVHGTPDADGKYPKTDYVAFDPSQVSTVNANASKSAGLLAMNQAPMIAHHNTSLAGLKAARDIGGIPMPSIAISNAKTPVENFGDISLLMRPDQIDPKSGVNVFPADGYTGRQPKGFLDFTNESAAREALRNDPDFGHFGSSWIDSTNGFSDANYMMQVAQFGRDRGIGNPKDFKEIRDYNSFVQKQVYKFGDETDQTAFSQVSDKDGLTAYGETQMLINPKEPYTPSGQRRDPKPYTLDEAYKRMRQNKANQAGSEGHSGPGLLRAVSSKQFKSLDEIKKNRGLLKPDDNDMADVKGGWDTFSYDAIDDLAKAHFDGRHRVAEDYVTDLASGKSVSWAEATPEARTAAQGTIKALREEAKGMPTEYFEAKPKSVQTLGDFDTALVPAGNQEAIDILRRQGVKNIQEYGDQKTRAQLMQEQENLLFANASAPVGLLAAQPSTEDELRQYLMQRGLLQ